MAMWMVRGDSGRLLDDFRSNGIVAIGWHELLNVAKPGVSRQTLLEAYASANPEWNKHKIAAGASQVWRFINEMKPGDHVLTYNRHERVYWIGEVTGDFVAVPKLAKTGLDMQRATRWIGKVDRDALSTEAKNNLGGLLTVFRVSSAAETEVLRVLGGERADSVKPDETEPEEVRDTRDLYEETEYRALEFIKDRVAGLDWSEMQELVAGILRAMGYKTRVAKPGPDRGADIIASPDGLGFENPRIVVEVKHRTGSMGSKEVRSFLGGRHKDDRGLYVSTGGFTKEARYEADRAGIPIALWELEDLVEHLVQHYDQLDNETRQLVPLKRIYWPA